MEFPDTPATRMTEEIMSQIKEHLQPDEQDRPHHYNSAFSAVYKVAKRFLGDGTHDGIVAITKAGPLEGPGLNLLVRDSFAGVDPSLIRRR
jgi:hypothetical protein